MKFQRSLLSNAAIYALANFSVAGVPLILLPILTRYLSADDYGKVGMFTVVSSFLFVIVGFNTHGAVMVRFFDSKFALSKYVSSVFLILLSSVFVTSALIAVFPAPLLSLTTLPVSWLIIAVGLAGCQFLVQLLLTLWQCSDRALSYGVLRLSHAITDSVLSIFLVVGLMASWEGRLSGLAIAWSVIAIFAFIKLRKEGWVSNVVDKKYIADALRYGLPLMPHAVGGLILSMADRLLVTKIMDIGSTGIYFAAVQIGLILGILADASNRAFAPWLMKKLTNASLEEKSTIVYYTYLYFLIIIFVAIILSITIEFFIPFLLGPGFIEVSEITFFMFLGNAFTGMYYMVTNYVFFSTRTGLLSLSTISTGIVSFLISIFLIQNYGLLGAAISFMIGQILLFLTTWALAQYCYRMPWFGLLNKMCKN